MFEPPSDTPLDENEEELSEESLDRLEPVPEELEDNGSVDEDEK